VAEIGSLLGITNLSPLVLPSRYRPVRIAHAFAYFSGAGLIPVITRSHSVSDLVLDDLSQLTRSYACIKERVYR